MCNKSPVQVVSSSNNGITAIVTVQDLKDAHLILSGEGNPLVAGCRKFTFAQDINDGNRKAVTGSRAMLNALIKEKYIEISEEINDPRSWGWYVPFSVNISEDMEYVTTTEELFRKFGIIHTA
jgi:hypothetical protein